MDMMTTTVKFREASQAGCSPMATGGELPVQAIIFHENGYGSTTHGTFGYKKLPPAQNEMAAEFDLDAKLALLCDKLRARY